MALILIVDDSILARRVLARILRAEGHEVAEAGNGLDALESFSRRKPDLILTDMVMEGMYGIELVARLQAMDPAVRVIIAAADSQELGSDYSKLPTGCGIIHKPFLKENVMAAVDQALVSR